jgi:hypothetical protein
MLFLEKPFWLKLWRGEGECIMERSWRFETRLLPASFPYARMWDGAEAVNCSIWTMRNNYGKNRLFFRMRSTG